jgi:hypothetical protein
MASVVLNGSTSGQITLAPAAVAGTNTITFPASTGTVLVTSGGAASFSNIVLNGSSSGSTTLQPSATASGTVTLPAGTGTAAVQGVSTNIVTGTAVTPTSGTTASLATGIPSWVKRITVHFYNVAMGTATTSLVLQLGTSGGFVTTGYASSSGYTVTGGGNGFSNSTNGMCFGLMTNNATQVLYGTFVLTTIGGNIWVGTGINAINSNALISANSGYLSLGGVLTQLQMTTIAGTGTFSAGTFNILYE